MIFRTTLCILAALLYAVVANAGPLAGSRPNIILVMTDDQGIGDLSCMVENLDENFGALLDQLKKWNALENTLVIFMTDNGATHLSGKLNGKKVIHFNAGLRGGKNSPFEGGTHVPAFWQWQGRLGAGVDIDTLTAHLDLYPAFCDLAGVTLPETAQPLDGRSLLPLLENADAEWPDRELFVHCGRWNDGKMDKHKFTQCAVRTERWRFINNKELYDIDNDPSESTDVAADHPEVLDTLRKAYDEWWASAIPLMVNEGLPRVAPEDQPLALRYHKQLAGSGIPEWAPKLD